VALDRVAPATLIGLHPETKQAASSTAAINIRRTTSPQDE
jgi:hypothetical protein